MYYETECIVNTTVSHVNTRLLEEDDLPTISEIYTQSRLNELRFEDNEFELNRRALFVLPSARDQAIVRVLLELLISKSVGNTSLRVTSSNKPVMQLYKNYGFTTAKEFIAKYNGQEVLVSEIVHQSI